MYNSSLIKYILSTLVSLSERKNKELIKRFYLNYQSIFPLKWQGNIEFNKYDERVYTF